MRTERLKYGANLLDIYLRGFPGLSYFVRQDRLHGDNLIRTSINIVPMSPRLTWHIYLYIL